MADQKTANAAEMLTPTVRTQDAGKPTQRIYPMIAAGYKRIISED